MELEVINTEELHEEIKKQIEEFTIENSREPVMIIINHKTFALFVTGNFGLDMLDVPVLKICGIQINIVTNSDVPYMKFSIR